MELTEAQLVEVLALIEGDVEKKLPMQVARKWVADNGLDGQIRPGKVVQQLRKSKGAAMAGVTMPRFVAGMAAQFCANEGITVESCDVAIAALQDAAVTLQAKKAELQA